MTNRKHDPGPWIDSKQSDAIIAPNARDQSRMADETLDYYGGVVIAESICSWNKPLIKAAPELLEACEDLLKELHDGITPIIHRGKPGAFDICTQRIARARKAIAKARGESEVNND